MVFGGDVEEAEVVGESVLVESAEVADGESEELTLFRGVEVLNGLEEWSILDLLLFQSFEDLGLTSI